jgi:hypothetical protein
MSEEEREQVTWPGTPRPELSLSGTADFVTVARWPDGRWTVGIWPDEVPAGLLDGHA